MSSLASMNDMATVVASSPNATVHCAHCSLPVPAGLVEDGRASFCCAGCRSVWHALHDAGLAAYYDMVQAGDAAALPDASAAHPARVTGRGFDHLDHGATVPGHAEPAGELVRCTFRVDGMHCGACVWLLESLPGVIPGLVASRVHVARGTIELTRTESARWSEIGRRLDRLGYQLAPTDARAATAERQASRRDLVRLGVAGALAVNAMGLAFALYGAQLHGMDGSLRLFIQWWCVGLAILSVAWPGRVFLANALAALRARVPHMDVPVSFGLCAAAVAAVVATVRGTGSIYAEGVTMLVFLLLVGRFVQRGAQRRAMDRIESASSMLPATAIRVGASRDEEVPIAALVPGDTIRVPAHDTIAADGVLLTARATIDCSHLTGESTPIECSAGHTLEAGSRCLGSPILVRVERTGADTRAAQIERLVQEAAARRAPICAKADAIAGVFLATVIALATGCALWWGPRIGWDAAMERSIALLVVTCPCALGLATPLAILSGIGGAARRGVLIKGGDVLERLGHAGTLVLDKTGTLTLGRPTVVAMHGAPDAVRLAAALEAHSTHPLARAVVAAAAGADTRSPTVDGVVESPGEGIEGRVDGHRLIVGSPRLLARRGVAVPDLDHAAPGCTTVVVAVNGVVTAHLSIADAVREDARATVATLRAKGWTIMMASGDDPRVVARIADEVGIDPRGAVGGLSPEAKLTLVERPGLARPVVMVGDGINDLAALAGADCGVAVHGGAQSSLRVADACLAADGMAPLLDLVSTARRTMQTVHWNLVISLGYNALGAAAAWAGLINPIVAAILMPVSGLTVLATSLAFAGPPRAARPRPTLPGVA